jgi:hypothetical protein
MSGLPKKRAAEQAVANPNKRAATKKNSEPDVVEVEVLENYHISTVLHSRFDIFPLQLRKTLQLSYTATVQSLMKTLEARATTRDKYIFSIILDVRVRQSSRNAVNTTTICGGIPSLSLANTVLLDRFLNTKKKFLEKPSFVYLKTDEGIANPDFIQLHSVRRNEIGWGFDTNGCLSLYLVYMEDAKLNEYALFVQRTEIKIEEIA